MVSSTGLKGGVGRCFPEWQSFVECYSSNSTTDPGQCSAKGADYYECLHHKKEKARAVLLANEFFKQKEKNGELKDVIRKQFSLEAIGLVEDK